MKILFGVFDWGIGHATRDIPLIEELLKEGNEVHIVSTSRALLLLKKYFRKKCIYFDVPSIYSVYNYKKFFKINFTLSSIKILKSLHIARKKSAEIIKRGGYDKIISDCRYDVYDKKDNSYLINHQLRFSTIFGTERILEMWLEKQMNHYKYIIVPDFETPNLSGRLSHNLRYLDKKKIKYIGILSHIKKKNLKKDIDYFISLSGPEETRKDLLKKILSQKNSFKGKVVIAGGTPENKKVVNLKGLKIYNFLNSKQQENFMNRAKFVIIRAGYTTIMELAELGIKKVLLIPSPGQTEQMSLTDYYEKENYFHHVSQRRLNLIKDIKESYKFKGFNPPWKTKNSVKKFIKLINK